jgi:hypothetical protein
VRRLLLILSAALLVWAALVLATGGIQWRIAGVLFRSRDPGRVLLLFDVLVLVQALLFPREFASDIDRAAALVRRGAPWLATVAAALLAIHGLVYGSFTAGGADAYGYVSQAYGWASGHLPRAYDLPLSLPFPSSDLIQTPLGYRPGPQPHTMVPNYAPGLPLLMAAAILSAGAIGPYLIVPACAALFVWFTFLLGRRAAGPTAGLIAAILVATSPVVLFQNLWPMSDVPAGALWTGAIVAALGSSRRSAALSGLCTAIGLFVRPNLLLLVLVPFGQVVFSARGRERVVRALLFCAPIVPVVLAVAALNAMWFGSPFRSGYGRTADLYSLGSVWPNLQRYPVWLWQSQSPWIVFAALSVIAAVRPAAGRPAVRLAWILFTATVLCYIAYFHFDAWWYLRFLLPGLGAFFVLVAVGLTIFARRMPQPWGRVAAVVILFLMVKHATAYAVRERVFGPLKSGDHRYADVGDFVGRTLPENAVVFTMQHSGTIRFYGGRLTLRYDFLDMDWADRAPAELERLGLHPYLAIDDWEVPYVQMQFKLPTEQALPWPHVARMRENGGVTIYDLATEGPRVRPVALEPGHAPLYGAPKKIVLEPR